MKCKNCIHLINCVDFSFDGEKEYKWCPVKKDNPDIEVERDCMDYECMTNADRIRLMSDEELAILMDTATDYFNCDECEFRHLDDCGTSLLCQRHILKWLKQEADENEAT